MTSKNITSRLEELRKVIEHNDLFEYAQYLLNDVENFDQIIKRNKIAKKIIKRFQHFLIQGGCYKCVMKLAILLVIVAGKVIGKNPA